MNDVVLGAFLLLALCGVSFGLAKLRRRRDAPWRVAVRTTDGVIRVVCVKPHTPPLPIGQSLSADDPDRGLRLAELRAEAKIACIELNSD